MYIRGYNLSRSSSPCVPNSERQGMFYFFDSIVFQSSNNISNTFFVLATVNVVSFLFKSLA